VRPWSWRGRGGTAGDAEARTPDPEAPAAADDEAGAELAQGRLPTGPLKWAFITNWGQQGITLLVSIMLAAIVGPRAYGIVALAIIYIAFIQLFLDQGISQTIIQRADLEDEHLDSAFWMNLAWSVLLVGVSIVISHWWARATGTQELELVIDVLSVTILLQALTVVQQALLRREMKFKRLALRSNVAAVVGGIAALVFALEGAGIWSLVAQRIVTAVVALVLLWVVAAWTPRFSFSTKHARHLLGFSVHTFAGNVAVFTNRRVDALMVGLFFGPAAVGLYRLADRLVESLLQIGTYPVQMFALSHFSRLQHQREALRQAIHSCMRLTMLLTVPLMLVVFACSNYIVEALGPQWEPAGNVLKLLAIVGIGKTVIAFTAALLIAVSKPQWRAIMQWALAAVSAAVFAGAALMLRGASTNDQVLGMATSRVALFLAIFLPVNIIIIMRTTGLSLTSILGSLKSPLVAGLAAIGAVLAIEKTGALPALGSYERLALAGAVASIAAMGTLLLIDRGLRARALAFLRPKWRVVGRTEMQALPVKDRLLP
jgi:O-antigen/teichoic acid export membrane protein